MVWVRIWSSAAPPAYAHAYLLETSPVDGEVLASAPEEMRLRFDEAVSFNQRSIQLLDVTAKKLPIGTPGHVEGKANTARVSLPTDLAEGTYVVAWRVTSADSHVVAGAFSFSVGHPSAVAAPLEPDASRVAPVVDGIGRALAFLGMALAVGGALFVVVLWPAGRGDRRGRRVVWSGFGALTVGTLAVLLVQGPYAAGTSLAGVFDPDLLGTTLSTRLGHALVARLVIVLALGVLFGLAVRPAAPSDGAEVAGGAGRIAVSVAAAVGAVALTLTWTLADHAQTGAQTWVAVPAASLHLLAMALWLGGLVLLVAGVLVPGGGRAPGGVLSLAPVLPRFSRLAEICFAVIAVTGGYLAWRQVGTWAALVATEFGQLLLGKVAAVLVVVGLAAGRGSSCGGVGVGPLTPCRWWRCAGCAVRSWVRSCSGWSSCRSRRCWSTPSGSDQLRAAGAGHRPGSSRGRGRRGCRAAGWLGRGDDRAGEVG